MEDEKLLELFFERSEEAIGETERRYGSYLYSIAKGITGSAEDAEECVNDTYLRAWNAIPPARPARLGAYLARIVRNIALDKLSVASALKRGGSEITVMLSELEDTIPDTAGIASDEGDISAIIDSFLRELGARERTMFVRRYFYADSIEDIAAADGSGYRRVTSMLYRMRKKLRIRLQKEGIIV